MAVPPPRAATPKPLTPEQEREALDKAHAAKVKEVERVLDAAIRGKNAQPGETVTVFLPIGPEEGGAHDPEVLSDIEARYVGPGRWSKAEIARDDKGDPKPDKHGRFVLTLTP